MLGLNIYQFLSQEPASAEDDFSSATLVGRVQSIAETFTLKNPKLGFHHYFQVAATNVLGEGPKSIVSAGTYCDTTPDKPSKPKVKKLPKNTVMVHIQPPRSSGSGVSRFVIEWSKESEPQSPSEKSSRSGRKTPALESTNTLSNIPDAQRMEVDSSDLARALTDLDSGFTYRFRIIAKNACGQSVPSEFSDAVCLDDMLSTPTVPTVEIMSSTSVHVTMPDIQSFAHPSFIRKIAGFHVLASAEASMAEAHVVATVKIPSPSKKHAKSSKIGSPMGSETSLNGSSSSAPGPVLACVVSDLKKNGDYFIAVQCFGTISGIESRLSPSAWAPLATAVPLPAPSGSLDSIAPTTAHSAGKSSPMAADHSPSAGKYKGFMSPRSARAQFPNSAKDSQEVHASPPSSGRLVAKGTFVKNSTTATSSTDEVKKTGMSAKSSTVITASASTKRKSAGVAK